MPVFRALPTQTCWNDVDRVSVIRTGTPGTLVAAWQDVATGTVYSIAPGDLPTGNAPIRLGVLVDGSAGTMHCRQAWGGAPASVQIGAPTSARVGLHSMLLADVAGGTDGELVALTDDEECEVDANGEPVGDPGEDYTASLITQLGGLVVRFLDWSSRNHPSTAP